MVKMSKKAFTLVELIVVITILAILGTIAFISLQGYSAQARDSKRITDVSSLISKVNVEVVRGDISLSDMLEEDSNSKFTWSVVALSGSTNSDVGKINFPVLRESETNFQDPSIKGDDETNPQNYVFAYSVGSSNGAYNLFQLATVSESEGKARVVGTFYTLSGSTAKSLLDPIVDGWDTLPYPLN